MKSQSGWERFGRQLGILTLGATAGSVLALLYAPASGKVTRRRIEMQLRTLGRSTGKRLYKAKRMLAKKAKKIRLAATEKLNDTREWLVERAAGNGKPHPLPRRVAHHN